MTLITVMEFLTRILRREAKLGYFEPKDPVPKGVSEPILTWARTGEVNIFLNIINYNRMVKLVKSIGLLPMG